MVSNTNIDLSIIVPIYNVEDYLDECLTSIYAIEGGFYEVILINDGSTDNSAFIIENFVSRFSNISIVVTQKNRGLSEARNSGVERASGQYILFVDSDDWIDPSKIPTLIQYAMNNNLDLLHARADYIINSVHSQLPIPDEMLNLSICNGRDYLDAYCNYASIKKRNFRPEVWLSLYKTAVLVTNNIKFHCGMYYEDELFVPNFILHCDRIKVVDIVFYNYRIRNNSITSTFTEQHVISKAMLVNEYILMMKQHRFYHSFLNGRMIGWSKESLKFVEFKQLFSILFLKKKKIKDTCLLLYLIIKKLKPI